MAGRGVRRTAVSAVLAVTAALTVAQSADAVTCCYTIRLGRTVPQPLWVGVTSFPIGRPVELVPNVSDGSKWELLPADTEGGRAYHFRNRYSLKCLDIVGPNDRNGTPVHQWSCHSGASQAWKLIRPPIGRGIGYQFINVHAHKCLDVTEFSNRPQTLLQVWSCTEAWNQDFVLNRTAP